MCVFVLFIVWRLWQRPPRAGGQALSDVLAQEVLAQDTTIAARDGYALGRDGVHAARARRAAPC